MLRALSRFLDGRDFPGLGISALPASVARLVNRLPRRARELLYIYGGWSEAVPSHRLTDFRADDVARWMVSLYPRRRYPGVMIGSSNGANVHLCAALGM